MYNSDIRNPLFIFGITTLIIVCIFFYFLHKDATKGDFQEEFFQEETAIGEDSSLVEYEQLFNSDGDKFIYLDFDEELSSEDKWLYIFNAETKQKAKLPIDPGRRFCMKDGEMLYVPYKNDKKILSYNFKDEPEFVKNIDDGTIHSYRVYNFSADCSYAILIFSTYVTGGSFALYDIEKDEIIDISSGGRNMDISPDRSRVAFSKGTIFFNTGADQELSSIYLEDIDEEAEPTLLLAATKQESYYAVSWVDNNTLLFEKDTLSSPIRQDNLEGEAEYNFNLSDTRKVEYFTIDINTKEILPADEPVISMVSPGGDYVLEKKENVDHKGSYDIFLSDINGTESLLIASDGFRVEDVEWLSTNKVYTSEEYGFKFSYPLPPEGCTCNLNSYKGSVMVGQTSLSTVYAEDDFTLDQYVDGVIDEKELVLSNKKDVIVGGEEAVKISYRFGGTGRYGEATFVKNGNQIFIIEFVSGVFCCYNSDEIYDYEVYDSIISTLEF